uniref:Protein kinase domain-containing protein n=1 Tax=Strigamia maritima TaxID=126957 RepID=T1JAW7_STRMM
MDVFNKLRNTVSSTVSQLSGVLPGNPVTREFEATRHIGSYGPGLLWKIYSGFKKSTKQEAAIFVFEKKLLEKYVKSDRFLILDILRKGVSQLTRLRHPKILTVQHPLEESRDCLAFATEPVFLSLANALGQHENMPMPLSSEIKEYKLYEVEIKYGILQLAESLTFLHNDVRLVHRNICPESIIINKNGAWKIAGFDFCVMNTNSPDKPAVYPFHEWDPEIHVHAQPNLDFLAPEYALTLSCDTSSDMFSLGVLVYTIFNDGKVPFCNNGNFKMFKQNSCELKCLPGSILNAIPSTLRDYEKMLLNVTPEVRPDAHQFTKIDFFEDVGAKTLQYLDSLFQWDNLQKSHFYKGLPTIINKMPKRVNLYRILPCLLKEFRNIEMVPFVLPNVLLIAEDSTPKEFQRSILPDLKPIFKIEEPIQIMLIFLQKMDVLLTKTPPEDIRNHVLPLLYSALESNAQPIQELCLSIIPGFAHLVEYSAMKNALLPRIKNVCINTSYLSVRVNCLICIGKLLEHLDKWLVLDDVLPILQEIPSKEPAVLMGILGIYKLTMTHKKLGLTKEVMATKILPFLVPLSIENGLTLNQFNAVIALVKEMIQQVETEHRNKLQQLNSIQHEQRSTLEMSKFQAANKDELISGIATKPIHELDSMFEGLGLGSFLEEKDVCKVASGFSPTNDDPMSKLASQSLSLEDKQRLVREQEMQQRLKTEKNRIQPMMTASPMLNSNPVIGAKPKDLTDTLIQSNLQTMSRNYPTPFTMVQHRPMAAFPSPNWQVGQPIGIAPFPRMAAPGPVRPDLSAFDNLLNKSSFSSISTNNMKSVSSKPVSSLSKSDISDLLS